MIARYYIGRNKVLHTIVSIIPASIGAVPLLYIILTGNNLILGKVTIGLIEALIIEVVLIISTTSLLLLPKFMLSSDIDKLTLRLPHIILKLRTLIAAGEPPLKAFEDVAKNSGLTILELILKEIMLGYTPQEAVDRVSKIIGKNSTLEVLGRVMNAIEMGGESTASFLRDEFESLMAVKDSELRKALDSLSVIVELYMSMGVFAPIIGIIMLSSLAILGGIDVTPLITAIIFIAIPLLSVFSAIIAKRYIERALI